MAEVSEAAKAKACELTNADPGKPTAGLPWKPSDCVVFPALAAFARYIQQVSDAVKDVCLDGSHKLAPFILPDPVDPFTECIKLILGGFEGERHAREYADSLRTELAKRGFKIVPAKLDGPPLPSGPLPHTPIA